MLSSSPALPLIRLQGDSRRHLALQGSTKGLGNPHVGKQEQPGDHMTASSILTVVLTGRQLDVAAWAGRAGERSLCLHHSPASLPSRPAPPPPFPPDFISALIKMSSSEPGGAVNKGSKASSYLLGTVPGALEGSEEEKQVWGM